MDILQRFGVDFRVGLEGLGQLIQIHFIVVYLIARGESLTTHERQAAIERKITTLAIQVSTFARARTLTLGTATSSLTLSGGNTASDAFSILFGALIGHKI